MKALQKALEVSIKQCGSPPENIPFALRSVHAWNSCLAKGSRETPAGLPFVSI